MPAPQDGDTPADRAAKSNGNAEVKAFFASGQVRPIRVHSEGTRRALRGHSPCAERVRPCVRACVCSQHLQATPGQSAAVADKAVADKAVADKAAADKAAADKAAAAKAAADKAAAVKAQQEADDAQLAAALAASLAVSGPSPPSAAARVKRWGDGLEAPAAGSRHFVPQGAAECL